MVQRISLSICFLLSTFLLAPSLFSENISGNYIEVNEKSKVCMVNDFYNPMADFSEFKVTIDKKDYYGCCAMCKEKLTMSIDHREAVDPLTEEKVDKAKAYIVADKTNKGKTLYFKNKENFQRFATQ